MRITVRSHHQQLITNLALEMGCSPSEVLNYLLWQYRWGTPTKSLESPIKPLEQSAKPLELSTNQLTLASPKAIANFEQTQLQQEIDPIINKLAGLIEDF